MRGRTASHLGSHLRRRRKRVLTLARRSAPPSGPASSPNSPLRLCPRLHHLAGPRPPARRAESDGLRGDLRREGQRRPPRRQQERVALVAAVAGASVQARGGGFGKQNGPRGVGHDGAWGRVAWSAGHACAGGKLPLPRGLQKMTIDRTDERGCRGAQRVSKLRFCLAGAQRTHLSQRPCAGNQAGHTSASEPMSSAVTELLTRRGRSIIAPSASPQHLVPSTGAAMSTTSSHGSHAAQRPPSQLARTFAPVGNSPRAPT